MNFIRSKVAAAVLAASAAATAVPAVASDIDGTVVGISWPYIRNTFYRAETALVVEGLEEQGLKPLNVTDANNDVAKQLSDIQTALDQGAKALVIVPVDTQAVGPIVERAASMGIPVVGPDIGITHPDVYMNVRADNRQMGVDQCVHMGDTLGSGKVVYQTGALASLAGLERYEGFMSCMEADYPDIEVLVSEAKWDADVGASNLQTLLLSNPDISGIAVASDTVYTIALQTVLRANGKLHPVGSDDHIYFSGIDGGPEIMDAIRKGFADASVVQPLPEYSKWTAYYIRAALEGRTFEPGPTDHGSMIIEENGVLTDVLPALLATPENVESDAIWSNRILD